ncbi:CST complex subunit CTC1 [Engraulis encrasicolus]|uniref:CST complex subunit CTC1 n=1 Tax=Engraulis encrasicolus TaxID=184585 RepID=UPI002FD59EE2
MKAETAGPSTEVVGGLTAAAAVGAHARGCTVKVKRSKFISYKGVITAVTDQEAGLYMIDGKVGLLLAYQPLRGINSGLRPGAQVELQHVHFLFRPSISCYGPPTMLCACLRSSVRVTYFSPLLLAPQDEPAPSQSHDVLPRMLLERNLGVSEYLWLQHYSVVIRQRLCPRWVCEARACVVASRLLECVCVREERREPRDIYREMLQEPHVCPLNQYRVCSTGCVVPSVSEVCVWLEAECWSTLSLPSLLPTSEASGLMRAQLNPLLSWSFQTWSLRDNHTEDQGHQGNEGEVERRRPKKWALLVGMLESGPASATLKLRDQTGSIDIVLVEEEEEERVDEDEGETRRAQRAADNTAWLGCLVCVRSCTLVAERFLKTNFPSWSHLKEDKYITSKHCRVYLQLCVSDLQVLSPSTAMSLLLAEREKKDGAREEEKTTRNGERRPSVDAENSKKDGRRGEKDMTEIGEKQPGVAAEESSKKNGMRGEGEGQATNEEQPAEKRRAKRTRGEEKEEDKEKAEERGMKQTEGGKGGEESGERNKCKRQRTGEHMAQGMLGDGGGGAVTSDPCVSVVFRVEAKQGVALRNHQLTSGATASPGLSLSFVATVTCFGAPQRWEGDPRNTPLQQHENDSTTPHTQIDLQFISSAVRWFPLLHPDSVYRLIALHTEDVSVLRVKVDMTKGGGRNHGNPSLVIQPRWRIHTLAHTPMVTQIGPSGAQSIKTVSQILHDSACSEIVSFCGIIAQRISLEEDQGKAPAIQSLIKDKGVSVDPELRFRLTVEDPVSTSSERLQVYVDLSQSPFIPGLLPGAHILLTDLQRCLSRKGNVYCRFLPISCVAVTSLASEQSGSRPARAPPPMMLLGEWGRAGPQDEAEGEGAQQRCMLGKVKCHVTCVLHLKLQWTCSLCGSIYKQEHCSRTFPSCDSNTAVFQAEAKVAVEDGTGEAQVWFSSELVPALLSLGATEWEGLQWRMKARGHLRVYTRGWDVVSDVNQQDPLVRYLCALCSSTSICREITLTCQRRSQRQEMKEPRRMKRGEREFLSKFPSSLQLTCTHTH